MTFTPKEKELYSGLEDKNNKWIKKIDPMNFEVTSNEVSTNWTTDTIERMWDYFIRSSD